MFMANVMIRIQDGGFFFNANFNVKIVKLIGKK